MTSQRWFIVTNKDNLQFFYDCCLIVDRQAFPASSYMYDIQAERPKGFLPCFSEDNLTEALRLAKCEDENLITCLVEIELKDLRIEQLYAQARNRKKGEYESVVEEDINSLETDEVLLPSPLPLSCIKHIFLGDAKAQKSVAREFSATFGEFPPRFFNFNAKLFKEQSPQPDVFPKNSDPESIQETLKLEEIPPRELNYTKSFAYGGALFLSFYQTKNGLRSSELFELFENENIEIDKEINLYPLISWVLTEERLNDDISFYALIFDLIAAEDDLGTVHYDLLKLFGNKDKLPSSYAHVPGFGDRLKELIERTHEDDINTYLSKLIAASESKSNPKWSSKVFLLVSLLFIRGHSETLLKFYHDRFTEEDYFLLAVFFGLAKGIRDVPSEVRKISGLRDWVSFKMSELMHRHCGRNLVLKNEPSIPISIHKKYLSKSRVSKVRDQDALQKFCKLLDIDEKEIITWALSTKDKYTVESSVITFSKRPSLYAKVNNVRLKDLMLIKTIKDSDTLIDFNAVFKIFRG